MGLGGRSRNLAWFLLYFTVCLILVASPWLSADGSFEKWLDLPDIGWNAQHLTEVGLADEYGSFWCPHLQIVSKEVLGTALSLLDSTVPTSSRRPPIYFRGSDGVPTLELVGSVPISPLSDVPQPTTSSELAGVVRLTADDPPQVRWTFVIKHNDDHWRFDCVQPFGPGSGRGFYGVWTGIEKDGKVKPSPQGLVWFWKKPEKEDDWTDNESEYSEDSWTESVIFESPSPGRREELRKELMAMNEASDDEYFDED